MSQPPVSPALVVRALACRRGDRLLFRDLDFALDPGQTLVLHGPNGSGKSSLIRILAGLSPPDRGHVFWRGQDVSGDREAHCARFIHLGHLDAIKPGLSLAEHLELFARLGADPISFPLRAQRIRQALERLDIAALADLPGRVLSAGQRRRLALARLLVRTAPLWLLDEPTNALDARAVEIFRRLAAEHLQAGGMIVAATHLDLGLGAARTLALTDFTPGKERGR